VRTLLDQTGVSPRGVGCAIPGPLDRRTGMVLLSPNLGWRNVPFAAILSEACRLPVALDDDARCAAIGEWWRGERQHAECILFVVVGTGIGGALIAHNQPIYGATDNAGEIGHTVVLVDGPRCSCGKRGCLEAVASGWALAEAGRTSARSGNAPELLTLVGGSADAVGADHVLRAARRGSPAALGILENAGAMLGLGIANAVNPPQPAIGRHRGWGRSRGLRCRVSIDSAGVAVPRAGPGGSGGYDCPFQPGRARGSCWRMLGLSSGASRIARPTLGRCAVIPVTLLRRAARRTRRLSSVGFTAVSNVQSLNGMGVDDSVGDPIFAHS